ncbi:hypothetical protein RHO12_01715 [Orbus sturtevantii]|uniref:transcriptional regulator n=1 Tax=Orbus sturtevantii TaxID=3074109 RepID=UPI00370D6D3F
MMTGYELKLWRRGCGWCQEIASEQLGVTRKTYARYEKLDDVPMAIILATQALSLKKMLTEFQVSTREKIIKRIEVLISQT